MTQHFGGLNLLLDKASTEITDLHLEHLCARTNAYLHTKFTDTYPCVACQHRTTCCSSQRSATRQIILRRTASKHRGPLAPAPQSPWSRATQRYASILYYHGCLLVCLHAYLLVCLLTCLFSCLLAWLFAVLLTWLLGCLLVCLLMCLHRNLLVWLLSW